MGVSMNFNFLKRVLSALILFPLLILLILKGGFSLLLAIAWLCLMLCWYEWIRLFEFKNFFLIWGALILSLSLFFSLNLSLIMVFHAFLFLAFLPFLLTFEKESYKNIFFPFLVGLFYLYLGFMPIVWIAKGYPRELLVYFFSVVFATDTGAYLAGKLFGKRPFFAKISPKKTWEGFFGGLLIALLVGIMLNRFWGFWSLKLALILTLALSLWETCGDLFESAVKRVVEKKDSGALIPGHGGLLDRIDGVLFASPLYFIFLEGLNYGAYLRVGL